MTAWLPVKGCGEISHSSGCAGMSLELEEGWDRLSILRCGREEGGLRHAGYAIWTADGEHEADANYPRFFPSWKGKVPMCLAWPTQVEEPAEQPHRLPSRGPWYRLGLSSRFGSHQSYGDGRQRHPRPCRPSLAAGPLGAARLIPRAAWGGEGSHGDEAGAAGITSRQTNQSA